MDFFSVKCLHYVELQVFRMIFVAMPLTALATHKHIQFLREEVPSIVHKHFLKL